MKNLTSLSLKTVQGELFVLDQTLLPQRQLWILCQTVPAMVAMIKALQLRKWAPSHHLQGFPAAPWR